MSEEYENSILENKENTLFTSSLIHVLGNQNPNQLQRSNENESLNLENQQSIYEVLNKYSISKIKNAQNQSKILDMVKMQRNNPKINFDQSIQQDYLEEIEQYLDNLSLAQIKQEDIPKKQLIDEPSLILTKLEHDSQVGEEMQNISSIENNNGNWEIQLEQWLDNANFRDCSALMNDEKHKPIKQSEREEDDDLNELEQILK